MNDDDVNDIARIMMDEWERVEQVPVAASYVATFADMARALLHSNYINKRDIAMRDKGWEAAHYEMCSLGSSYCSRHQLLSARMDTIRRDNEQCMTCGWERIEHADQLPLGGQLDPDAIASHVFMSKKPRDW